MGPPPPIGPTLDHDAALSTSWDAVIIGAGPAGALAARQLAAHGARALLLDKSPFPRPKVCGCCLNASAVESLDRCGLSLPPGANHLHNLHLASPNSRADIPLRSSRSLSRSALDAALVRHAIAAGAHFLPGTSAVIAADTARACIGATSRPGSAGRTVALGARAILSAEGLAATSLRNLPQFSAQVSRSSRIGLAAILPSSPLPRGHLSMSITRRAYVGMVRLEDNSLNIAAAIDPAYLRSCASPAHAIESILAQTQTAIPLGLHNARFLGTPALTRRRPVEHEHIFLLGDAASYVEPFTGEGIAWALASARAITPHILNHCAGAYRCGQWSAAHHRLITHRQLACRALSKALRRPRLTAAAIAACAIAPQVPAAIIRGLHHHPNVGESLA